MIQDVIYFIVGLYVGFTITRFFMEITCGFDTTTDEYADPDQIGAADAQPGCDDAATGSRG